MNFVTVCWQADKAAFKSDEQFVKIPPSFFKYQAVQKQKPSAICVVFQTGTKEIFTPHLQSSGLFCSQAAWRAQVTALLWCRAPRAPSCNIITLVLDTNISPSSQTFSPLHCNYCMHACADGTHLLLFGSFAAVAPVWLSRVFVCHPNEL